MVLKVSIAGVRGDVNIGLTPEVIMNMSLAYGTYMKKSRIVIGTDTRPTGEMVKGIVISALLATGCKVLDIGIAPTPVVAYMVKHLNYAGGIIISASHNDIKYNALKLLKRDGIFLDNEEGNQVYDLYVNKKFNLVDHSQISKPEIFNDASKIFVKHLKKYLEEYVDFKAIRKRNFKIIIDAVNGAGSVTNKIFFEELGIENVKYINSQIDKPFPRSPEPIKENLKDVEEILKKENFDISFVQDPDADRLGFFTPKKLFISEELTLPIAIEGILDKLETSVVVNLATSQWNDNIVKNVKKVKVIRVPIGEANVVKRMQKEGSLVGGEGNGGVIFSKFHLGRDSYVGIALILNTLIKKDKTIDELVDEMPFYFIHKEKLGNISFSDETIKTLKETFYKGTYNFIDGVYYFEKGQDPFWFLLRPSNTEPIVRLQVEGKTEKQVKSIVKKIKNCF
jgi:phosphomannomutase